MEEEEEEAEEEEAEAAAAEEKDDDNDATGSSTPDTNFPSNKVLPIGVVAEGEEAATLGSDELRVTKSAQATAVAVPVVVRTMAIEPPQRRKRVQTHRYRRN